MHFLRTASFMIAGCELTACAHVRLSAPTASAPGEDRVAAYEQLQPVDYQETATSVDGTSYTSADYVLLGDGTKVTFADDLLPLVPRDSSAAESMRLSRLYRNVNHLLFGGGVIAVLGGLFLAGEGRSEGSTLLTAAGTTLAVSGVISFTLLNWSANRSSEAASKAFREYDAALRRRLHVCSRDDRVVPCP